jgi:transposase
MSYFLKKTKKNKGLYLQIYRGDYDPRIKNTRQKCIQSLGYFDDLVASGIEDPLAHFQNEVDRLNEEERAKKDRNRDREVGAKAPYIHLGYFPIKCINDSLGVKRFMNLLQEYAYPVKFNLYDLLSSLVYARLVKPCSKRKTFYDVLPYLYESQDISLDQLYRALDFFGTNYEKIIELYNASILKKYPFETDHCYFDCTNFYFEIDHEDELRRKGPSKENRFEPLIGMALLLDARQIPLGMKLYAGNESEYPYLESTVGEMKDRLGIEGRTIRVADKGLNSAKNLLQTVRSGDGYIFSKSVLKLPKTEQEWILSKNDYTAIYDEKGQIEYWIKSCVDDFSYKVHEDDGSWNSFTLTEKRVVNFNPHLAKKKREEITKQVEKAKRLCRSQAQRSEYGDSAKYVLFEAVDEDGVLSSDRVTLSLNWPLIEKHWKLAGYSLIVTSEIKLNERQIYLSYHGLWRIEESFRMMKSELETRPIFLQTKERIFAHFLICYLAVLFTRIFQIKILDDRHSYQKIIAFIREFNVAKISEQQFLSLRETDEFAREFQGDTGLPITHAYLNKSKVKKIMNYRFKN